MHGLGPFTHEDQFHDASTMRFSLTNFYSKVLNLGFNIVSVDGSWYRKLIISYISYRGYKKCFDSILTKLAISIPIL